MFSWLRRLLLGFWRIIIATVKGAPVEGDELLDMHRIIAGMWPITVGAFCLSLFLCGKYWARGAMWCLACLAVGAAVGFLFGIPKVLQREGKTIIHPEGGPLAYRQRVNTNLEEISDWLTKIIVGLGLVQLARVPGWINNIALLFAESIEQDPEQRGVLAAVIVFFLVGGFLFGYLITRLFLQGALGRADRAAAYPDEGASQKLTIEEVGAAATPATDQPQQPQPPPAQSRASEMPN
jgi:hypothetical protein